MLAAVLAASTLASCADDSVLESAGQDGRRGSIVAQDNAKNEQGKTGRNRDKQQGKNKNGGTADDSGSGPTQDTDRNGDGSSSGTGNGTGTTSTDGTKTQSKPAVSCSDDFSGDMEGSGSMPSYSDLERGCVREDGTDIVLAASTVGALPARMPDQNTNLAIAFELTPSGGRSIYVQAESTDDGWTATLNKNGDSRTIAGPRISGDQLVMTIPASELGASRKVSWNIQSSWLKSTLTSTEYAFDDAPNGSTGSFDRG